MRINKVIQSFLGIISFLLIYTNVIAQTNEHLLYSCTSGFHYKVVESISPLTIEFTADCSSNSPIQSYVWTFGDGEISTKENPQHQYLEEGLYDVSLKIKNQSGDSSVHFETIKVSGITGQYCTSYFTFTRITTSSDYTYSFTDHSISSIGTINYWKWTFGDGSQVVYSQNPIHQFMNTGNFQVILETHSDSGCISTYTVNLLILSSPNPIDASFTFKKDTTNSSGLTYLFHDNSSSSSQINQWKWYFEDGDSSIVQDPTHTFPYGGIYYITLRVKNTDGYSSEVSIPIQVGSQNKYNLWGRVYAGSYVIDKCIAYLYKEFNNNYFVPTDTIRLTSVNDTLGVYYFFQKYEGKYRVKVLTPDNSIYSDDYAPTYYGNSKFWDQASTLNLFNNISQANVNLVSVNPISGNAKIEGKIINQSGKIIPKEGIELLLLNNTGNIAAYTYTDSTGFFSFKNLAIGTYSVYVELTGFKCIPIILTINQPNDSIVNTQIFLNNQTFIGIEESASKERNTLKIYPNPSTDIVWIDCESNESKRVEIYNMNGILLQSFDDANNKSLIEVNLNNYITGIYYIKVIYLKKNKVLVGKFLKN